MRQFFAVATIMLTACITSSAHAFTSQYNITIDQVGVQSHATGPRAYFTIDQSLTLTCNFGVVFVDMATIFGRAAYAQLLAAKLTNSALARFDYSQAGGSGSDCFVSLVAVQN